MPQSAHLLALFCLWTSSLRGGVSYTPMLNVYQTQMFSFSVVAWKSQMVRMEVQAGIYTTSNIWKLSQNFKHHEKCKALNALAVIWLLVCYMTGKITNEGALILYYIVNRSIFSLNLPRIQTPAGTAVTCMDLISNWTHHFTGRLKKKTCYFLSYPCAFMLTGPGQV